LPSLKHFCNKIFLSLRTHFHNLYWTVTESLG